MYQNIFETAHKLFSTKLLNNIVVIKLVKGDITPLLHAYANEMPRISTGV